MSKGGQLAIAVVSVFAAIAWIVSSSEGTFVYFHSVSEMLAERAGLTADQDRDLRVHGFVVNGSIEKDLDGSQVWFAIQDGPTSDDEIKATSGESNVTLTVVYNGIDVPDLFADGAEVVVEGNLTADTFEATRIMAKCPSKYENAPEGQSARVANLGEEQ